MNLSVNFTNEACLLDGIFPLQNSTHERIIDGTPGYVLWGVLFVIISIFGMIGNVITIIVLKRDPAMSALTIILIGLAVSDIMAPLANFLLAFSYYHLEDKYSNSVFFLQLTNYVRFFLQPLSSAFTMSSSWIITTTTLFRLIAVKWPFKARTLINKNVALTSLISIFTLSLLSVVPIYSHLKMQDACTDDKTQVYKTFVIHSDSYFFLTFYGPVLQALCFYLPWLTSLFLWIFLIKLLQKTETYFSSTYYKSPGEPGVISDSPEFVSNKLQTKDSDAHPSVNGYANGKYKMKFNIESKKFIGINDSRRKHDDGNVALSDANTTISLRINNARFRQKNYNRITLMVAVLCFINLICQIFTFEFIFEIILEQLTEQSNYAKIHFPKFTAYCLLFNNIFLGINHSCNIIIYTLTNPKFKRNLIHTFEKVCFSSCRLVMNKNQLYKYQTKYFKSRDVVNVQKIDKAKSTVRKANTIYNASPKLEYPININEKSANLMD